MEGQRGVLVQAHQRPRRRAQGDRLHGCDLRVTEKRRHLGDDEHEDAEDRGDDAHAADADEQVHEAVGVERAPAHSETVGVGLGRGGGHVAPQDTPLCYKPVAGGLTA